jgi:hypothetical protein
MIAFWFSIHLGALGAAKKLYEMDKIIPEIMRNFRTDEAKAIIESMRYTGKDKRKKYQMSQTSNDMSMSMAAEDKSKEVHEDEVPEKNKEDEDVQEDEQIFKDNDNDEYHDMGGTGFKKIKSTSPLENMANDMAQKALYKDMVGQFEIKLKKG